VQYTITDGDCGKINKIKIEDEFVNRGCYFPSGPDGHLAPSYAISRLGPRAAASNCGRRHGGYTSWHGSKNSRRGLVGEVISPLWFGRVRVRVMGGLELG